MCHENMSKFRDEHDHAQDASERTPYDGNDEFLKTLSANVKDLDIQFAFLLSNECLIAWLYDAIF